MNRRGFLKGLAAGGLIVAAPAIVREGLAMPVKAGLGEPGVKACLVPAEVFHSTGSRYYTSAGFAIPSSDEFIKEFYTSSEISELATQHALKPLDEDTKGIAWSARPLIHPIQPGHHFDPKDLSICSAVDIAELKKRYPDPPIHPSYAAGHPREGFEYQQKFIQEFLK